MTGKMERFAQEYLVDMNATKAAERAGYNPKTAFAMGSRILKRPDVQEAIAKERAKQERRTQCDADYVIRNLMAVVERCSAEERLDSNGANKALELLGKHLGMFTDKQVVKSEISGPGGSPIETAATVTVNLVRPKQDA